MNKWILTFLILVLGTPDVLFAANLYQQASYRALTSDRRAYHPGDLLTVIVLENSSATSTSDTTTDKSNNAGLNYASPNSQKNYGLGLNEDFDGGGKVARSGKLLAQISVTVIAIDPNGDLHIKGEQVIELNGEKQAINLEGRVRQRDIDESNSVVSSRIADAHIVYVGDGVLAESQHKGWLSRVISFLGLL